MMLLLYACYFFTAVLVFYAFLPLLSMWMAGVKGNPEIKKSAGESVADFACIITAYGDASIAIQQVHSLIRQSYSHFHIYMVGDHCKEHPDFPNHPQLSVIYPEKSLHSKIKSIQKAIEAFKRPHNYILILDADNLLHVSALENMNQMVVNGCKAIQGQRTAKNLDTPIAALDALSELYYNVSQRWAPYCIGSSATIAGSGMAIEASFFRNYVNTLLGEGDKLILAEDKLLQMMLVESGIQIAYCREALIFDEKVREGAQVQRQRTRWLRSWFDHWGQAIKITLGGIKSGNWNRFYFGLMLSVPPMFLLVGGLLGLGFAGLLFSTGLFLLAASGLGIFGIGFLWALLLAPAPQAVWRAIPFIPVFALRQLLAILKIKASNKDFMATTHTQDLSIEKVWSQRKTDFPYL